MVGESAGPHISPTKGAWSGHIRYRSGANIYLSYPPEMYLILRRSKRLQSEHLILWLFYPIFKFNFMACDKMYLSLEMAIFWIIYWYETSYYSIGDLKKTSLCIRSIMVTVEEHMNIDQPDHSLNLKTEKILALEFRWFEWGVEEAVRVASPSRNRDRGW